MIEVTKQLGVRRTNLGSDAVRVSSNDSGAWRHRICRSAASSFCACASCTYLTAADSVLSVNRCASPATDRPATDHCGHDDSRRHMVRRGLHGCAPAKLGAGGRLPWGVISTRVGIGTSSYWVCITCASRRGAAGGGAAFQRARFWSAGPGRRIAQPQLGARVRLRSLPRRQHRGRPRRRQCVGVITAVRHYQRDGLQGKAANGVCQGTNMDCDGISRQL